LPEFERKTLLHGEWNVFAGQYFTEFDTSVHVCEPFVIPEHYTRYRVLDYGLDMLACLWVAVAPNGKSYIYKELHESDLIISEAARRIIEVNGSDKIRLTYAPSDLWGRTKDTGRTIVETFRSNGVHFTQTSNDRVKGWMAVKEYLKVNDSRDIHTGDRTREADLVIFSNCINLIKNLPQIQRDEKNPNDCATKPHDITHICDALRYYCVNRYADYEVKEAPSKAEDYDYYVDEMTNWG
jgi:phage terminase large subunit